MVAIWIKFLKSQNKDISLKIYEIIEKIINWDTTWLDIKPLSWKENYFRCRIWNIRIIYTKNINWEIEIKKIWYRWDIYK
jgi:hypothetical protein